MSKALGMDLSPRALGLMALIAAVAIAISIQTPPDGAPKAMVGLAIVSLTVALWATAVMPALHSGVVFFALALASGVAPTIPLISGFWSNAAMLVLGGLILGGAAERTGLGRYVARSLMGGISTYPHLIAGILIGSTVLSFLVPSTMGRLAIMVPVLLATAKEAGYEPGSNGYVGIVLTAVAGNYLTSYGVMTANLTNVISLGAYETLGGATMKYGAYLLMCMPILGLVKTVMFWAVTCLLLPAPPPKLAPDAESASLTPAARRLAILLVVTLLLWMTDYLHHVKPGLIALLAGLVCLLPMLDLARPNEVVDMNKFTSVFALPAVLGVATVLTHSGAGAMIAATLAKLMPASGASPSYGFMLITFSASLIAIGATIPGSIAIVTPTLPGFEAATGLPLVAGLNAMLIGLQSPFFAFEAVPVMVGLMMGKVAASAATRILVPLAITGLLVVAPLQMAWLKLIGVMP
jgi:di/tricarboxylate transporter